MSDEAAAGKPTAESSTKSGKELKLQQKAEKAARRAAEKATRGVPTDAPAPSNVQRQSNPSGTSSAPGSQHTPGSSSVRPPQGDGPLPNHEVERLRAQQRPRTTSQGQGQRPLALRKKPSTEKLPASKEVSLFGHLYTSAPKNVSPDVHPAVLALGKQMSSYIVCGSSARCVATLLAFKQAIKSYSTPQGMALNRHMPSHFLSEQIKYLVSHRPMSISMGNAIRWLKEAISKLSIDLPESTAKSTICTAIDDFIQERITAADALISSIAAPKIKQGDHIVIYAMSHIVTSVLLAAHASGTEFSVTVIDSRPLFEGKTAARKLSQAGIRTSYTLINAAAHAIKGAQLCLLGAHGMMSNGRLCARVGTANVALLAHGVDVPVIVCCESVKFSDRVALDSIVMNELAGPDELVLGPGSAFGSGSADDGVGADDVGSVAAGAATGTGTGTGTASTVAGADGDAGDASALPAGLGAWRQTPGLQLLNIMYDYTPAEYIDMVITEYGSLPPTSVPVVYSISTGDRQAQA